MIYLHRWVSVKFLYDGKILAAVLMLCFLIRDVFLLGNIMNHFGNSNNRRVNISESFPDTDAFHFSPRIFGKTHWVSQPREGEHQIFLAILSNLLQSDTRVPNVS
jgi:hypothetical protein